METQAVGEVAGTRVMVDMTGMVPEAKARTFVIRKAASSDKSESNRLYGAKDEMKF